MPLITIRGLTSIGRAGNQLFLYCFAKGYAHHMGCELQVPDWWGRKVFVHADNDPKIDRQLPQTKSDAFQHDIGEFFGRKDIDINVFAQHQRYLDFYTRKQVLEWLRIKPEFDNETVLLKQAGYSAAHLRYGDYLTDPYVRMNYCHVSEQSYLNAVERYKIPEPILWVHEGWRNPPLGNHGLDWWSDFLLLKNATHLLRANSTFSWWAATLGNSKVYAPVVGKKHGPNEVEFVAYNFPTTAGKFPNQSDLHLK